MVWRAYEPRGQNIQLEAIRAVDAARNGDLVLASSRLKVEGNRGVERRPVNKVDQVQAEGAGVGVDSGPLQVVGLALGEGRVGGRLQELDGGNERRREGEKRQDAHIDRFVFCRRRI